MWRELTDSEYAYVLEKIEKKKMIVSLILGVVQILSAAALLISLLTVKAASSKDIGRLPLYLGLAAVIFVLQALRTRVFAKREIYDYEAIDTVIAKSSATEDKKGRKLIAYTMKLEGKSVTACLAEEDARYKEGDPVTAIHPANKNEKNIAIIMPRE